MKQLGCDRRTSLTTVPLKLLPQPLPALEVLMVEMRTLERKFRWLAHEASLEHERQSVAQINRRQCRLADLLKGLSLGSMPCHAIVQAGAARHKPFSLRVIFTANQPHELVHEIAMKPRRTKCML